MTPWQSILMIIINKYVRSDQPFFHRYQIMKPKNKDAAVLLLYKLFDCKEYPEKVERTMRRALRDLRDNGYVEFFYPYTPGKYKLTTSGYEKLRKIMD